MDEKPLIPLSASEFGTLFSHYKPRFVVIARSYVRDEMVAEDLVNDSFLSFWESRETIAIETCAAAYILSSVRHKCLNWLRDQRIRMGVQQTLHSTAAQINENRIQALEFCDPTLLFADEVAEIIRGKLEQMPERMRRVFTASRFEGKTYQEIALLTGIPVRSVTADIQKALDMLRGALKDYLPALVALLLFFETK